MIHHSANSDITVAEHAALKTQIQSRPLWDVRARHRLNIKDGHSLEKLMWKILHVQYHLDPTPADVGGIAFHFVI